MKEDLVYVCEICQTVLEEHHCKAVCPNCGRMFDCSDLPLIQANGTVKEDDHAFTARPGSDPRDLLPRMAPEEDADGEEENAHEEKREEETSSDANLP
jgi:uncharacterized Zn finger protein (UPF0148 family)